MTDYWQVSFNDIDINKQEILIALLSEAGFEGFQQSEGTLRAYIPSIHFDREFIDQFCFDQSLEHSLEHIKATNWNQVWESNFQPVVVHDFAGVRACFHEPLLQVKHDIIITPKMSFGTGHHATTFLMIEEMSRLEFSGKKVLDFGTGTGILAILAEKLGAAQVDAIDHDDWSMQNAAENLDKNKCSKIRLVQSVSAETGILYGIILANINRNVILENLALMERQLETGGFVVLSGLLEEDTSTIVKAAEAQGFSVESTENRSGWMMIKLVR